MTKPVFIKHKGYGRPIEPVPINSIPAASQNSYTHVTKHMYEPTWMKGPKPIVSEWAEPAMTLQPQVDLTNQYNSFQQRPRSSMVRKMSNKSIRSAKSARSKKSARFSALSASSKKSKKSIRFGSAKKSTVKKSTKRTASLRK